jgi:hypothetical protein
MNGTNFSCLSRFRRPKPNIMVGDRQMAEKRGPSKNVKTVCSIAGLTAPPDAAWAMPGNHQRIERNGWGRIKAMREAESRYRTSAISV